MPDREAPPRPYPLGLGLLWWLLPAPAADLLSSRRARVRGPSMAPTLEDGDLVLVSRAAYVRRAPARGDIVLARLPGDGAEYVKRVVGLPGEEVHIQGGLVSREDVPLVEPYVARREPRDSARDGRWTLGNDEYLLLGDNREDSLDSRAFGPVPRGWIRGRVWYVQGRGSRRLGPAR